ncbi:ABC transporter permease [Vannielia litorea]|uniref:Peptide/nickel transport system permease protein n=1 Tax=Vannielia litorea TaxID=1217970 RepID=A0A1N6GVG6_9RHOB|nr:ABC transporter permease [Vannielia litorea]SIO11355.1 peptide/nickel transport system permease protein [Vannielia litorea]
MSGSDQSTNAEPTAEAERSRVLGVMRSVSGFFRLLSGDLFASIAFAFLVTLIGAAIIGPIFMDTQSSGMNLSMRNAPPFTTGAGIEYILGGDLLGRPILPRILIAARTTLTISLCVVALSLVVGTLFGVIAGYYSGRVGSVIMRGADLVMSFPSLLLAMIVLYVLEPYVLNVVIVLAITRTPVYIRVARAEVLEVKERLFVEAARSIGASDFRLLFKHVTPIILPTLFTVASLDLANVMLAESSLSFLGIGVQPPDYTWGVMVASGRNYLTSAWWLAFWPGLAILLTALSANLLSSWMRIAMDPKLSWRLERRSRKKTGQGRTGLAPKGANQ